MRTATLWAALFVTIASNAGADEPKPPEGFLRLFNGKDLTGWKVAGGKMEVWGVEDGMLYTKAGGGGWLMTDKTYNDFELRLEYRMPKMGNSGVAIRAPRKGQAHIDGLEIQLLDDENWKAQNLKPYQYCGSVYGIVGPSKHVTRPHGEWNQMRITAKGPKITVELNGTVTVEADLDEHKNKAEQIPGVLRRHGHIGLQSYNFRVDFRNIYLKPL